MFGSLMIDLQGTQLTKEDIVLLQKPEVGGIILFARNVDTPEQVQSLCTHIRSIKQDIIIGVDQEGGRVTRLRQGFSPLPAMGKLGHLFDNAPCEALSLAFDCGYLMAAEVMAVGIDVSFAPVLDIDGMSQVIGDRSFHGNTQAIVALSAQFMRGMKDAGMSTTGKHFPGHGSITPDSHIADAIDHRNYEQILKDDLQPFIQGMPLLDALMPAHVIFSQIDDKPAGFSSIWLKDIVRKQLGFEGVLFSDDLSMKAAHIVGDVSDRVKAALEAGCDMALVCNNRQAVLSAINSAKALPQSHQARLKSMQSDFPEWKGNLQQTCLHFDYWQQAQHNIMNMFFGEQTNTTTSTEPDPTYYTQS